MTQCFNIFFELHSWVKKCHFDNFSERPGMAVPVSVALKNASQHLKNSFCLGADEYVERLEGKLRKCLFFYAKIF